jgi:hypothetical protein
MRFSQETESFIKDFVNALKENNAVVFAGAGMSIPAGYFDWKKLLEPVATKLGLIIAEEYDLTLLAQFFVDTNKGRGQLNQLLAEEFHKAGITPTENHKILSRLPINIFWTTNFDSLIEDALKDYGKTPDVKRHQADLAINLPKRDAIIYKMHGDITDISNVVFTKHDYEDYYQKRELFSNAFKADFVSRTMLFIGFSFSDPNLDYLISRIRTILRDNPKADYYFIKEEEDTQKIRRQKIRVESLKAYGLHPIWIKAYSEITDVLKEIERRILRNTVLISGSAHSYGDKWGVNQKAEQFIHDLSKQLSKENLLIVSGFGLGVGSSVINGVLENMTDKKNQNIDEYLILRPFPQFNTTTKSIKEIWKDYRVSFIPLAGVAIFVFGNKLQKNEIVKADGMIEEFEIAVQKGLKVIPIGCTGFVSQELYEKVMNNFTTYYPDDIHLKKDFELLGSADSEPQEIISIVIKIMKQLNK